MPSGVELPAGLELVRTTPEFTAETMPDGLRKAHRVAAGVWGRLRVLQGTVRFTFETDPPSTRTVSAGEVQVIPPEQPHFVEPDDEARFVVEFHRPPS